MQPREWEVCLTFKPCNAEHAVAAAAGVASGDLQQGRLPDAGFSRDKQGAAVLRRLGQGVVELSDLHIPTNQPRSAHSWLILLLPHV